MADHIPTFADICTAIAEGSLAATIDGSTYQVNAFELRRFLNSFRSLPTISFPDARVSIPEAKPSPSVQPSVV